MNNDLISRSALLELAHNHVGGTVDCNDIARFPVVDAEVVRHGRWVHKGSYIDDDFDRVFEYSCSICGRCIQVYDDISQYPYCHCGAKMDAEVHDDA